MIVGQRVSSQGVVQMYGQNLKAIGSHLLGDEVLKVVTGNAKTAEASLDSDLPAACGAEIHFVGAIAQNATRTRGKLAIVSDPPEKGVVSSRTGVTPVEWRAEGLRMIAPSSDSFRS